MINLDKELVSRVKGLKLTFKEVPQPELLIRLPNRNPDVNYVVEIVTSEFTSLCPLNSSQPDYATIVIVYKPDEWLVELKSLKFYLCSFRMVPVFHEDVPATILSALVDLLTPKGIVISGRFTTRGGLDTVVVARWVGGTAL